MIVTLAGRRTDASDAKIIRFPLEQNAIVHERIWTVLRDQQAHILVSSAACGSDLLALDAAGKLGIRRHIVLPFSPERFRAISVVSCPGPWGSLFDRIISEVEATGDLIVLQEAAEDTAAFARTNRVILDESQKLSVQTPPEREKDSAVDLRAVIVWEGKSRGEGDLTADFADKARARFIPVIEIRTQ